MSDFKLTYSTMFAPPEALHVRFEQALVDLREELLAATMACSSQARMSSPARPWRSAAR